MVLLNTNVMSVLKTKFVHKLLYLGREIQHTKIGVPLQNVEELTYNS